MRDQLLDSHQRLDRLQLLDSLHLWEESRTSPIHSGNLHRTRHQASANQPNHLKQIHSASRVSNLPRRTPSANNKDKAVAAALANHNSRQMALASKQADLDSHRGAFHSLHRRLVVDLASSRRRMEGASASSRTHSSLRPPQMGPRNHHCKSTRHKRS